MSLRTALVFLVGILPMHSAGGASQPATGFAHAKEKNMTDSMKIPFGISEEEIAAIEISLLFNSQKPDAGDQEVLLFGSGKVRLRATPIIDGKTKTKEGTIEKKTIIALLALMDEERFLGLQDRYPFKSEPHGIRVLTLKLPRQTKQVIFEEGDCPQFERIAGAVKLAAGIALPEALGMRFFSHF